MRKRIDTGNLCGEGGVHQVAEGKAFAFGKNLYDLWLGREVQDGWRRRHGRTVWDRLLGHAQLKLMKLAPVQPGWFGLFVFPPVDCGK